MDNWTSMLRLCQQRATGGSDGWMILMLLANAWIVIELKYDEGLGLGL